MFGFESGAGDALVDAAASSGPATAAVIVLATILRAWFTDIKVTIAALSAKFDALSSADASQRVDMAELRSGQRDIERRLSKIEGAKG